MRIPTVATILAALSAAPAFAQVPPNGGAHPGAPQHPGAVHSPAARPNYTIHPGARGFVHNPMWRHPAHLPANGRAHSHFHFAFAGHTYIVLAGPIFFAPYNYYPYVSTPYYPASFYSPNDPDTGYFLYYCPSPAGYYPDVTDCPAGWWQTVPDDSQQAPGYY
jgi:hypothetical protein